MAKRSRARRRRSDEGPILESDWSDWCHCGGRGGFSEAQMTLLSPFMPAEILSQCIQRVAGRPSLEKVDPSAGSENRRSRPAQQRRGSGLSILVRVPWRSEETRMLGRASSMRHASRRSARTTLECEEPHLPHRPISPPPPSPLRLLHLLQRGSGGVA